MKKKWFVSIAIIVVIATSYYYLSKPTNNAAAMERPPATVDILKVEKKPVQFYNELPGRLSSFQEAEIRPQVTGIIMERLFVEGSQVKEGDKLYQIDPALYDAEHTSSKANLLKAQSSYNTIETKVKRFKELLKNKSVSEQDYEDTMLELERAKAEIAIAQALVKKAKINLDYTNVFAPISGQIGVSTVTKGALVTANQATTLTTITRLDPIYLDMTESSEKLMALRDKISSNTPAQVTLFLSKQDSQYKKQGKLQFTDVNVDKTTDSISLRAIFPNPDGDLLPGLFVRAKIHLAITDSILVPQQAVIRGQHGQTSVWRLKQDNTVEPIEVVVGHAHENQWEIVNGLTPGDRILLNGFQKIYPGAKVNPTHSEQTSDEK